MTMLKKLMGIHFIVTLIIAGICVNLVQAALFIALRPLWKNAFRRANAFVVEYFWGVVVYAMEWHAGHSLDFYFEEDGVADCIGRERAVVLTNHGSDVDWAIGWCTAARFNCLGGAKCLLKRELSFVPTLGWSQWFSEYTFLRRNWQKDRAHIERSMKRLRDYPLPFWVVIYAEGTRMSPAKLAASQEFAKQNGLPVLDNVLTPRTKGWMMTMSELRNSVDAVYTYTLAMDSSGGRGGINEALAGNKPVAYHAHIKRTPIAELPKTDEELQQWCRDEYVYIDGKLGEHKRTNGTFSKASAHRKIEHRRKMFPLILVVAWNLVAIGAAIFIDGAAWVILSVLLLILVPMILVVVKQDTSKKQDALKKR